MMNNLKNILKIDKSGSHNEALKMLYSDIYDILSKNEIDDCDLYLQKFLKMDFSILLKVGFVRITKPHKEFLKNREKLILILKENLYSECSVEESENVLLHII